MKKLAMTLMALVASSSASAAAPLLLYKTPGAPVNDRVDDLVKRMNLDEKVNQLVLPFGAEFPADYASFNKSGLGGTYPLNALPGQTWIETRNAWQKNAVENTRLGIPTSFIAETLHSGYSGGTNFPMPCLQGSTWNRPIVQAAAAVIGMEAAASGIDRGFSPVLHFCTDPRFGRCEESFGEVGHQYVALPVPDRIHRSPHWLRWCVCNKLSVWSESDTRRCVGPDANCEDGRSGCCRPCWAGWAWCRLDISSRARLAHCHGGETLRGVWLRRSGRRHAC